MTSLRTPRRADGPSTAVRSRPPLAVVPVLAFTVTTLMSAALLFAVEPMVAKLLLPPYGGSPMVWNTSVLFFQVVLLAGYAYAHWAPRLFGRWQPLVHIALSAVPLLVLPVVLPSWAEPSGGFPVALWLLGVLAVMVGLPFGVLATTGPLIQRWYAGLDVPRAHDPYFLYAASNTGSLVALLAYPLLIEPSLDLNAQSRWWGIVYVVFAVALTGCALMARFWRRAPEPVAEPVTEPEAEPDVETDAEPRPDSGPEGTTGPAGATGPAGDAATPVAARAAAAGAPDGIDWRRRLVWLGLAALPSSLNLGVTTHITTDIAPVPLLWVIPLSLYLITYIAAFASTRRTAPSWAIDIAAVLAIPTLIVDVVGLGGELQRMVLVLFFLTVTAYAAHSLLAADRPPARRLTEFFLVTSAGGALGALFNGLIAPAVFDSVAEYPLAVALVALLPLAAGRRSRLIELFGAVLWLRMFLFALAGVGVLVFLAADPDDDRMMVLALILICLPVVALMRRPVPFAIVTLAIGLFVGVIRPGIGTELQERTFFGSYNIVDGDGRRTLSHGTTRHGSQLQDPAQRRRPLDYYDPAGPAGDIFAAVGGAPRLAVVGLGTGALAGYGRDGQRMDFYEIDPEIIDIARDPKWFSYLSDCPCDVTTRGGDGRLALERAPDGAYNLILLDAFSSDAIPTHLMTREAIRTYARKLAPGGMIAFHVSNRVFDLDPMVASTAKASGLHAMSAEIGFRPSPEGLPSSWVVLARDPKVLERLRTGKQSWNPPKTGGPVWTDAYSPLWGVIRPGVFGTLH